MKVNVQPTLPNCIVARNLRFELDQEGLDAVAKDCGVEPEAPGDWLTNWFLKAVEERMLSLGQTAERTDFDKVADEEVTTNASVG